MAFSRVVDAITDEAARQNESEEYTDEGEKVMPEIKNTKK